MSADMLGNVFVTGHTDGSLAAQSVGRADVFVSKMDASGGLLWSRQIGTSSGDFGAGVSADGFGNVYVSGYTEGSLGGPNAGDWDAFVTKYDDLGNQLWIQQLGTTRIDRFQGMAGSESAHTLRFRIHWRQPWRTLRRRL